MKIVFVGTVKFSKKMLQKLIELDALVVGVCTKENSNFNSDFANLRPLCEKNKIPFKLWLLSKKTYKTLYLQILVASPLVLREWRGG